MQMGLTSVSEEREPTPERLNSLRNFTSPPVKWASKRRTNAAAKVTARISVGGDRRSPAPESIRNKELSPENNLAANARGTKKKQQTTIATPRTNSGGGGDGERGMEAARPKLVLRLKTSVNVMPPTMKDDEPLPAPATENVLPWNLRKTRGECDKRKELKIDEKEPNCSLFKPRNNSDKTKKVKKFSVELSKKEIKEDFMAIMGHPPPRKPNKRPKVVQNQLNNLCPGLWLREVTPNLYEVPDSPKIFKVPLMRKRKKGKGSH